MQQRQQIRDQLGAIEERLEELGELALANERDSLSAAGAFRFGAESLFDDAFASVRDLSRLVYEQQLLKSVPAQEFLLRICGLLVQAARTHGVDLSISHYGEGKISLEMAELVLGAIVAAFRSSLRGHEGVSRAERVRNHLFPTASVYLEVRATGTEVHFRLTDDGRSYPGTGARFEKLREHVAQCGGWFGYRAFSPCGSQLEFKAPLAHNRLEALELRRGGFSALIPSACVLEVAEASAGRRAPADALVYQLHEADGLAPGGADAPVLLRVGVADLQFWIAGDAVAGPVKARRAPAEDLVEPGCWLRAFGIFQDEGQGRALPLLDGAALVQLQKYLGGDR